MSIFYSESYNTFSSQLIRGLGFERPFVSMIIQNVTECLYLYVQIYNLSYSVSKIYLSKHHPTLSGALISTKIVNLRGACCFSFYRITIKGNYIRFIAWTLLCAVNCKFLARVASRLFIFSDRELQTTALLVFTMI